MGGWSRPQIEAKRTNIGIRAPDLTPVLCPSFLLQTSYGLEVLQSLPGTVITGRVSNCMGLGPGQALHPAVVLVIHESQFCIVEGQQAADCAAHDF